MSDSDLVLGLRERNPAAFQRACDRYLPSLWRYVYTRVNGDPHLAEDVVSETLLALIKTVTADSTDEIANPGGWLRTVANNKVRDHFRAVARVRHLIDDARKNSKQSDDESDPAKQSEQAERQAEVRQAMDQLPGQFRMALEWKYLEKLSVREISERWEMTEKAVESVLFRARRELRERLQRQGIQEPFPQARALPPETPKTAATEGEPPAEPDTPETDDRKSPLIQIL